MNIRTILAIIRKDLKVVSQNKGVMAPIIIAPLFMFGLLPWLVVLMPALFGSIGVSSMDVGGIQDLIQRMPLAIQQELARYPIDQAFIIYVLVHFMAPLFMVIPLMVSIVIAADSFAGEKERKTMEALLYTPTTNRELFIAKLLSGWLAAIRVAFAGFVLYAVMANASAWSFMGRVFFPNIMWLALIFWVAPALPGLGLGVMVLISARAQGFQDAYQLGNLIVLPVVFLTVGQALGIVSFSLIMVFLLGLVIWLLDGLLIWLGSRSFRGSRLIGI